MHDPNTLAFEIKYPWWKHKPWPKKYQHSRHKKFDWEHHLTDNQKSKCDSFWDEGYRNTFISVWHVDPECDGSDDSCGWTYPKLTNLQKNRLWNGAWGEGENPHFLAFNGKEWEGSLADAVSMYTAMVAMVVRLLRVKYPLEKMERLALERIHWPDCWKGTKVFCFQPGYHTNNKNDSKKDRQEHFYGILCGIAKTILREQRPWYKHPKWHFWHWRLQIHPLQNLKRKFWDKCCKCGKRGFKSNDAIGDWNGTRIWHGHCDDSAKQPTTTN
jgi:hypothetical protein